MERNIFLVWLGPEMSENRKKALDIFKKNANVKITLITDNNLKNFEVKKYPIHEGYYYLNPQNQCDYLRSYMMHHYGGAYADIKPLTFDWNPYFEKLESSDKFIIGSSEIRGGVSWAAGEEAVNSWRDFVACPYFICKKNTPFTSFWYSLVQQLMDKKLEQLKENPGFYHPLASTGGYFDSNHDFHWDKRGEHFPFQWNEIHSGRFHLAQFHFKDKIIQDMPKPITYADRETQGFKHYR